MEVDISLFLDGNYLFIYIFKNKIIITETYPTKIISSP